MGYEFLSDALLQAEPEGYIRTFIDVGSGLVPILRTAVQKGITPEYAGRILTILGTNPKVTTTKVPALAEALSDREIQVLRLVTAGLSNREIAERLYITTGTAKTHLHNLCGKLGVRNRTEAAARARELDLL